LAYEAQALTLWSAGFLQHGAQATEDYGAQASSLHYGKRTSCPLELLHLTLCFFEHINEKLYV
jgi:hypothetical protein